MRVRKHLVAATVLLVLLWAGSAAADSGSSDDPRDTGGKLDVARVAHGNDGENATYRLETHEAFDIADVFQISWQFDFDQDGNPADACVLMKRIGTTHILRAELYGECGQETWATADARLTSNSIEFSLPLIDLVEGGGLQPGRDYSYRVTTQDSGGAEDTVPEEGLAVHEDVPAPTPRPGSAETQLGYEGDEGLRRGAGGGARSAVEAREEGAIDVDGRPAEGIIGEEVRSASANRPEFRFGPVPVCSGSFCFAVAAGVPLLAAAVFVLTRIALRRRRAAGRSPSVAAVSRVDADARSSHGHL